jgi:hypothetical protein
VPLWSYSVIYLNTINWVLLTYNFNFRKYELIDLESSLRAFLLIAVCLITFIYHLFTALPEYQSYVYSTMLFFPCYSNPLLKRRRWTGILQRGVLGYVLPRLPFLWCYRVFRCSVSIRVILVFRDIIYVIIIPYSWHLVICEHFWPYVWNNWSSVMHTMSTCSDI